MDKVIAGRLTHWEKGDESLLQNYCNTPAAYVG